MPRRSILSAAERDNLLALPDAKEELIRHYTFSDTDLSIIRQRRGPANRLGFAVQLCYMRYPGVMLAVDVEPFPLLLSLVAKQLKVPAEAWTDYGQRAETRREHLLELQSVFGFQPFATKHYRSSVHSLDELAWQTDKGIVLANELVEGLRRRSVLLPSIGVIERICAEAITRATRRIHETLSEPLSDAHRHRLDGLLKRRDNGKTTWLAWLRLSPVKPNSRHMLEHIERLKTFQLVDLPEGLGRHIHQNRLLGAESFRDFQIVFHNQDVGQPIRLRLLEDGEMTLKASPRPDAGKIPSVVRSDGGKYFHLIWLGGHSCLL